ncbi:unnamed protein product [Pedinophyceae sp. YPF-701]|nr:unnamed protein product [Pedinophyceae sp. YPF-701]
MKVWEQAVQRYASLARKELAKGRTDSEELAKLRNSIWVQTRELALSDPGAWLARNVLAKAWQLTMRAYISEMRKSVDARRARKDAAGAQQDVATLRAFLRQVQAYLKGLVSTLEARHGPLPVRPPGVPAPSAAGKHGSGEGGGVRRGGSQSEKAASLLAACSRVLIFMGDVDRYTQETEADVSSGHPSGPIDYRRAFRYYFLASQLDATFGHAWANLGVLCIRSSQTVPALPSVVAAASPMPPRCAPAAVLQVMGVYCWTRGVHCNGAPNAVQNLEHLMTALTRPDRVGQSPPPGESPEVFRQLMLPSVEVGAAPGSLPEVTGALQSAASSFLNAIGAAWSGAGASPAEAVDTCAAQVLILAGTSEKRHAQIFAWADAAGPGHGAPAVEAADATAEGAVLGGCASHAGCPLFCMAAVSAYLLSRAFALAGDAGGAGDAALDRRRLCALSRALAMHVAAAVVLRSAECGKQGVRHALALPSVVVALMALRQQAAALLCGDGAGVPAAEEPYELYLAGALSGALAKLLRTVAQAVRKEPALEHAVGKGGKLRLEAIDAADTPQGALGEVAEMRSFPPVSGVLREGESQGAASVVDAAWAGDEAPGGAGGGEAETLRKVQWWLLGGVRQRRRRLLVVAQEIVAVAQVLVAHADGLAGRPETKDRLRQADAQGQYEGMWRNGAAECVRGAAALVGEVEKGVWHEWGPEAARVTAFWKTYLSAIPSEGNKKGGGEAGRKGEKGPAKPEGKAAKKKRKTEAAAKKKAAVPPPAPSMPQVATLAAAPVRAPSPAAPAATGDSDVAMAGEDDAPPPPRKPPAVAVVAVPREPRTTPQPAATAAPAPSGSAPQQPGRPPAPMPPAPGPALTQDPPSVAEEEQARVMSQINRLVGLGVNPADLQGILQEVGGSIDPVVLRVALEHYQQRVAVGGVSAQTPPGWPQPADAAPAHGSPGGHGFDAFLPAFLFEDGEGGLGGTRPPAQVAGTSAPGSAMELYSSMADEIWGAMPGAGSREHAGPVSAAEGGGLSQDMEEEILWAGMEGTGGGA